MRALILGLTMTCTATYAADSVILTFLKELALASSKSHTAEFSLSAFLEEKEGYSWQLERKEEMKGYDIHVLRLRSQTWLTAAEVNQPVWEHELRLTIPQTLKNPQALLYVRGGSLGNTLEPVSPLLVGAALNSGTIVAELSLVPVQPLLFAKEKKARKEDAIIAYSWRKFLQTGNPSWPVHLPMAKSITRAMDCIQEYCQNISLTQPTHFVLMGESKRAWAAWLAAAADRRVSGLLPISCDFLHVKACFMHHYCSYGDFSAVIRDYLEEEINIKTLQLPGFDELMQLEDPYVHRKSYTMPKYLIQAAGDPFSPPDSSRFYFSDLPSPKYLRYIPNAGHKLPVREIAADASAFYLSLVENKPLPKLSWEQQQDQSLMITTDAVPLEVKVWRAENPEARDFRYDFTKVRWKSETIPVQKEGSYHVLPSMPQEGWSAYFVEFTYRNSLYDVEMPLTFTTEVIITPDTLPYSVP